MITLFTIGIIFLVFEMIALALRATWGLMKAVFWVLGLPFVLVLCCWADCSTWRCRCWSSA